MTGLNWDTWSVGHCKIPALQRAKLPRYRREGAVEVRPLPAEKRPRISEAQGLSSEAMKGNPMTTVIPGADESKPSLRTTEDLTEPYWTMVPIENRCWGCLGHVRLSHYAAGPCTVYR